MTDKNTDVDVNNVEKNHELKRIGELFVALQDISKEKNLVSASEFAKFTRLFSRQELEEVMKDKKKQLIGSTLDEVDEDENWIQSLSREFIQRFDLYENISVFDDRSKEIVLILPRIFIPITEISTKNEAAVNKFSVDGPGGTPKHSAEATKGLLEALVDSQGEPKVYAEQIQAFREEYKDIGLDFIRTALQARADGGFVVKSTEELSDPESVDDGDFLSFD